MRMGVALVCGRPLELSAWRSPAGGAQGAERPWHHPAIGRARPFLGGGSVPPAHAPGVGQLAAGCDRLPAAEQGYALAASSPHEQEQLTL